MVVKVGIDQINFFTPHLTVALAELAVSRHEDPNKYLIGIGQEQQAVIPNTQDVVTMAANAAAPMMSEENLSNIDLIIFGTESGVDNSKSAAIYLQNLLGLSPRTRAFEIKQACYGATAGLQMAREYITNHPEKRALVIGADVARYGLHTAGEVTQGGGAVAMVISANPRILELGQTSTVYSEDVMDFWRPLAMTEAMVDGHYSNDVYIRFFQETWHQYCEETHQTIADFAGFVFHLPYTKMGLKALRTILPHASDEQKDQLTERFEASRYDSRLVGNLYTGSLYLSLLSLLDHATDLKAGDQIGLFSYGSGAQGEFFSGRLSTDFKDAKRQAHVQTMLNERQQISVAEYERIFQQWLPIQDLEIELDYQDDPARFVFTGVKDHQRQYFDKQK